MRYKESAGTATAKRKFALRFILCIQENKRWPWPLAIFTGWGGGRVSLCWLLIQRYQSKQSLPISFSRPQPIFLFSLSLSFKNASI